ncbi:MAG: DNA topoisomerase III [Sulfobacillus benefaciens]|uniref:DNA topoisomerase n=1 Tax=Sulfobacillus benefaciens TaxID=453960 RepID=A0A2T2XHY8_9FIRM|nr:MAG: DNA topoisomerase III [Sulfobacillus benefaciens]
MLIVTEKPSVGRDIAQAINSRPVAHDGYLVAGDTTVTWGFGHLVTLAEPDAYQEAWRKWSLAQLPMLPETFKLVPIKKTLSQFKTVSRLMRAADVIICATDADREGELIFRYIYQMVNVSKPVKRLWLSENTPQAILAGLSALKPLSSYDALAAAAQARAQADWVVGLNATRVFTLKHGISGQGALSVGRVQTPTLRIIADRDQEIANFTPTPYWQLEVWFETPNQEQYAGYWFVSEGRETRDRFLVREEAEKIAAMVPPQTPGLIKSIETKRVNIHPPLLFSLNDLQKEGNRRFGLTAQQVLDTAQSLYEKHLISYPRTEAKYLTKEIAGTVEQRLAGLQKETAYREPIEQVSRPLPLQRLINDQAVSKAGHYAIIPIGQLPSNLTDRELKIFDLVARRFIAALLPKGIDERTTLITEAGGQMFRTRGTAILVLGWRQAVHALPESKDPENIDDAEPNAKIPSGLTPELPVTVVKNSILEKETKAPPRFTDASILAVMEKHGLGTPATRARILEVLLLREYVKRVKKTLVSTDKGRALLSVVPEDLQNPELTGNWESRLENIAAGTESADRFLADIRSYTQNLVAVAKQQSRTSVAPDDLGPCPMCSIGRVVAGKKGWGCSRWRDGCSFTIWREIAGKRLTETQLKTLLAGKTTALLKGFKSKNGKSFSARLRWNRDSHTVDFIFPSSADMATRSARKSSRRSP